MKTRQRRPRRRSPRRRASRAHVRRASRQGARRWSQRVTETSNALDLESGVFRLGSAKAIAASLKRFALRSRRRKAPAYRSAASMLTFYINRAGRGLSPSRKHVLECAKRELRKAFGRKAER